MQSTAAKRARDAMYLRFAKREQDKGLICDEHLLGQFNYNSDVREIANKLPNLLMIRIEYYNDMTSISLRDRDAEVEPKTIHNNSWIFVQDKLNFTTVRDKEYKQL